MLTTFQKLCIRPEAGFVYDHNSMVRLTDGGTFTELLNKVTSKCDTSLLLLSSHKGEIKEFSLKIVGIKTPKAESSSVTSAVLSGFKKGLSFLNGSSSSNEVEPPLSDVEQVAQAWQKCEDAGYHGMHIVTLLDKEVMPDNECRKLYDLHQFMTVSLQSIYAYYMFQKPDEAFVYDSEFHTNVLKEAYPDADTFGIALIWRFVNNPSNSAYGGRIRATPIVRSSIRSAVSSASPGLSKLSLFDESPATPKRHVPSKTTTITTTSRKVTKLRGTPLVQEQSFVDTQSPVKTSIITTTTSSQFDSDESSSEGDSPESPPVESRIAKKLTSPIAIVRPAKELSPAVEIQAPSLVAPTSRRGLRQEVAPSVQNEDVEVRKVRGTPKRQAAARPVSRRGTKRQLHELDEPMDDEISFKPSEASVERQPQDTTASKGAESSTASELENQRDVDLQSINLPFDDPPSSTSKPRGGRKSMVASARKSLANEWPQDDQDHMLHFFDNLNPQQSETSRVALTCKYALIQYDRDLSSKLLFQWLERKGRPSQREVTDYSLPEEDQKTTVLDLYRKLSDVQSEATRVSFTLKFIQAQYGVAITSKQLFGWLKEKPKKGKK